MILLGGRKAMPQVINNEAAFNERAAEPASDDLHMIASELMKAIHSKDSMALKESLHSFFKVADTMPHEEYGEEEGE